jgi:uncharacterized membrane protein (TIGR02234 family)
MTGSAAADDTAVPPKAGSGRKYPIGSVVLLAVAAAALWGSSRMTWVTAVSSDGLTEPRTGRLSGSTWFGALTPLALVLLASIAAVLATRGWLRRLVGVLIALAAAVAAVPAFALLTGKGATAERAHVLAELPGRAHVDQVTIAAYPAWLTMFGAVVAFTAGVLLTRMPQTTAQLSGKYDNPVFRRSVAADLVAGKHDDTGTRQKLTERVLWDALDAGTDPTADTEDHGPREKPTNEHPDDHADC